MKNDANKNLLKLHISTYLEESLGMVGRMMLEDIFDTIEAVTEEEAEDVVNAHYDGNIFDAIAPYLLKAAEEYDLYKNTPEGQQSLAELREVREQTQEALLMDTRIKEVKSDDGDGNVH